MAANPELIKFEEEVKKLRTMQKQIQELAKQREVLGTQKNENELVRRELDVIAAQPEGEKDQVFKLVGPVMIKQDLADARDTIAKRLEYIGKEIDSRQEQIKDLQQKAMQQQAIIQAMQAKLMAPPQQQQQQQQQRH